GFGPLRFSDGGSTPPASTLFLSLFSTVQMRCRERENGGCCRSTESGIVAPRHPDAKFSCGKRGTRTKREKTAKQRILSRTKPLCFVGHNSGEPSAASRVLR